jgi:hypothetical protein
MHAIYTLHADDFPRWAERMKTDFHGKTLRVIISDKLLNDPQETNSAEYLAEEEEITDMADLLGMDETEYLMSSPANKAHLLRAIEEVKAQQNLVPIPFDDLDNIEKIQEHAKNFQERRAREQALEREALESRQ